MKSFDVARAKAQEKLSTLVHSSQFLTRLFMTTDTPSHLAVRWYAPDQLAGEIGPWAEFGPSAESGIFARQYKLTALIGANRSAFIDGKSELGGHSAVAFALGEAAMVGVLPTNREFGEHEIFPNELLVGMGIGRGTLKAAMGLWLPDDKSFVIPDGAEPIWHGPYPNTAFPDSIPRL